MKTEEKLFYQIISAVSIYKLKTAYSTSKINCNLEKIPGVEDLFF